MTENFFLQKAPFVVPTKDGKLIEEHIGSVATGESNSVRDFVKEAFKCININIKFIFYNKRIIDKIK